jgi:transposase InsO family protein
VGRNRLAWTDRATSQPVRRYEHPAPGCLAYVDIKKLGNIPAGGGHPLRGDGYVHAVVDDYSRLAYVEITATSRPVRLWLLNLRPGLVRRTRDRSPSGPDRQRLLLPQPCVVERLNRTLVHEWAYARPYRSEQARRAALPAWLHRYNQHPPHTTLGGQSPRQPCPQPLRDRTTSPGGVGIL